MAFPDDKIKIHFAEKFKQIEDKYAPLLSEYDKEIKEQIDNDLIIKEKKSFWKRFKIFFRFYMEVFHYQEVHQKLKMWYIFA
jgi:hypothetical protein